ncbi:MAG TPA: sigma-70 family RNA polymerase sigma factor [Lacunisphaera sp.]|jgi:RNA polymerase sigma factor (sigma-70 family)|nr:sigma-70 family RNA polymerase sigma factor [Lacunisphaera sp.]
MIAVAAISAKSAISQFGGRSAAATPYLKDMAVAREACDAPLPPNLNGGGGGALYTVEVQDALRIVAASISRKTGGAVDADELFSAAECDVAEHMASFDPKLGCEFRHWACRRGRWAMQAYLRGIDPLTRGERAALKARGESFSPIVHLDACPEEFADTLGETGPDRGEQGDDAQHAMALLGLLPPKEQALLRAHYLEGKPMAQIAAALGCSGETVRRRLRRSLDALRRANGTA